MSKGQERGNVGGPRYLDTTKTQKTKKKKSKKPFRSEGSFLAGRGKI